MREERAKTALEAELQRLGNDIQNVGLAIAHDLDPPVFSLSELKRLVARAEEFLPELHNLKAKAVVMAMSPPE